jgi:hypothetical protein
MDYCRFIGQQAGFLGRSDLCGKARNYLLSARLTPWDAEETRRNLTYLGCQPGTNGLLKFEQGQRDPNG